MRSAHRRPGGAGPGEGRPEGGIPDGLLLGVLALLLGATGLIWAATGLSGLFAHGTWPQGVHFTHTPPAIRHLLTDPQDLPGAWPGTPAKQLPGYGLFWGIFISELMVLFVFSFFAIGALLRRRAARTRQRTRPDQA